MIRMLSVQRSARKHSRQTANFQAGIRALFESVLRSPPHSSATRRRRWIISSAANALWDQTYQIEENAARFDGPLFDLPGGPGQGGHRRPLQVSDNVLAESYNNNTVSRYGVPPGQPAYGPVPTDLATSAPVYDPEPYRVWAGFTQLDIPVFGDNFNFPLVRKLDFEASWRHDQYTSPTARLAGRHTSNPKVAFTWLVDEMVGATVRGQWGTSFRFANAGEYSTVASDPPQRQFRISTAPLEFSHNLRRQWASDARRRSGSGVGRGRICLRFSDRAASVGAAVRIPHCAAIVNAATGQPTDARGRTRSEPGNRRQTTASALNRAKIELVPRP